MTKRIFLYLFIVLTASIASAQNSAARYIDGVINGIQKANGISVRFDINSRQNGLHMVGTLDMAGKKFRLETDNLITWYDGKTMWCYAESIGEVNITQPTAQEVVEINPYYILDTYVKYFDIKELDSKNNSKRVFMLTTNRRDIQYKEIKLTIDIGWQAPVMFELKDVNNAVTNITISQFDKKVSLPQSTFTFDSKKYPDAAVIDLR